MKKTFLILATISMAGLVGCGGDTAPEETTEAKEQPEETTTSEERPSGQMGEVYWTGSMMNMYDHTGVVQFSEVQFQLDGNKVTSGSFEVNMNSIEATDQNYNAKEGQTPEKLVEHLKSADFFDVANHPTATFVVTGRGDDNTVTGDLTIRGITNSETISSVTVSEDGSSVKGLLIFDRTKYGVSFSHPVKEMVLSNEVKLTIRLIN